MKICLIEPFYIGSHKRWADGYKKYSRHDVEILSLPGRHWKWRMHGGAVSLAQQFMELKEKPDLILATDMIDLAGFLGLTKSLSANIPTAIYFHENQLTYPWSPADDDPKLKRDNHYSFINYTSALAADAVFFNSAYHKNSFCDEIEPFLNKFPDYNALENATNIRLKSEVLYLGLDLKGIDLYRNTVKNEIPHLLWNHRWEYDKNPTDFFDIIFSLAKAGKKFNLSVVGEQYKNSPIVFEKAKEILSHQLINFGFIKSVKQYLKILSSVDILPVTSNQDFFGGSVVEAIYAGAYPLLPRRLAYTEHVPNINKASYFYSSLSELENKLGLLIDNFNGDIRNDALVNFVSRYDWTNLVEHYDNTFQNLALA